MNKRLLHKIATILCMALVLCVLNACSDDKDNGNEPEEPTSSIIGQWLYFQDINGMDAGIGYKFEEDGSCVMEVAYYADGADKGSLKYETRDFEYIYKDGILTLNNDSGSVSTDCVIENDKLHLTVRRSETQGDLIFVFARSEMSLAEYFKIN